MLILSEDRDGKRRGSWERWLPLLSREKNGMKNPPKDFQKQHHGFYGDHVVRVVPGQVLEVSVHNAAFTMVCEEGDIDLVVRVKRGHGRAWPWLI